MEALIFGAVSLAATLIFVALNALPFYFLYRVGSKMGVPLINRPALRWLFPIVPYALFIFWVSSSFSTFQRACKSVPGLSVLSTPSGEPHGFSVRGRSATFARLNR